MTNAYQCDRCGEYNSGSGKAARVGRYTGSTIATDNYRWHLAEEMCADCYDELLGVIDDFMGDVDE